MDSRRGFFVGIAALVLSLGTTGCIIARPATPSITPEQMAAQEAAENAAASAASAQQAALAAQAAAKANAQKPVVITEETTTTSAVTPPTVIEAMGGRRKVILHYGMSDQDLSVSSLNHDLAQSQQKRTLRARGMLPPDEE